jgi:anti-sigma-K factor RsiG
VDALPDFASLSDDDLALLIRGAEEEEEAISVRRRYLHGRIDMLRHARVVRLRDQVENGTLDLPSPATLERTIFEGTGDPPEEHDEALPDVATLSADELRTLILELEREEDDISLHRRVLHGRIDILRAERERRRRGGLHVEPNDLGPILGGGSSR